MTLHDRFEGKYYMSEQIFQIGVRGLIRNKNGKIFMVHLPKWNHNPPHWDLPGGRMDPGETFLDTLKRELREELGVSYIGTPTQLMGILTNITVPVANELLPLVFIVYSIEVEDPDKIKLANGLREDGLGWFTPKEAADLMVTKYAPEFCKLVREL